MRALGCSRGLSITMLQAAIHCARSGPPQSCRVCASEFPAALTRTVTASPIARPFRLIISGMRPHPLGRSCWTIAQTAGWVFRTNATKTRTLSGRLSRRASGRDAGGLLSRGRLAFAQPWAFRQPRRVEPMDRKADHRAQRERQRRPHVKLLDRHGDEQRTHERADDRAEPADTKLPA